MAQVELQELLCDFRRTETVFLLQFRIESLISRNLLQPHNCFIPHICRHYLKQQISSWQNLPLYSIFFFIQTAQRLNLQNPTKFLAKKYFDIFLSSVPTINEQKLLLVIITCLRVAIKFNELSNDFSFFTIQYCSQLSSGNYTQHQFHTCQIQLVKILDFKFRITTPYDFLVVKHLIPKQKKVLTFLETVIDFTITITQIKNNTAEEIFFGALLYCCKQKKANQASYQIIQATTLTWAQSVQISIKIEQKLKQLLQE